MYARRVANKHFAPKNYGTALKVADSGDSCVSSSCWRHRFSERRMAVNTGSSPRRRRTGSTGARRMHVDEGYRDQSHAHKLRVWISRQVRRVTNAIRREMRGRAAIERIIGPMKGERRPARNYLKRRDGDCANAVLAAGQNSASSQIVRGSFTRLVRRAPQSRPHHSTGLKNQQRGIFIDEEICDVCWSRARSKIH